MEGTARIEDEGKSSFSSTVGKAFSLAQKRAPKLFRVGHTIRSRRALGVAIVLYVDDIPNLRGWACYFKSARYHRNTYLRVIETANLTPLERQGLSFSHDILIPLVQTPVSQITVSSCPRPLSLAEPWMLFQSCPVQRRRTPSTISATHLNSGQTHPRSSSSLVGGFKPCLLCLRVISRCRCLTSRSNFP